MTKNNQGGSMNEGQYQNFMADNVARQQTAAQNQQGYGRSVGGVNQFANQRTPLSPEARQYFAQPAVACQICGNSGLGENPELSAELKQWELKWSIHRICAEAVWDQLDRNTGIASERR